MGGKSIDTRTLMPLERYIEILVEEFPNPISASELAEKVGVSKPAITKVRERLLQVCDEKEIVYKRHFLLRSDMDMAYALFFVAAYNGHHRKFLSSKYLWSILDVNLIHGMMIQQSPNYGRYFTTEDTSFIIRKSLDVLSNSEPTHWRNLLRSFTQKQPQIAAYNFIQSFTELFSQLRFSLRDDEELRHVIIVRDKFFLLVRGYLWKRIEEMGILSQVEPTERSIYLKVYKHTADHYLRIVFSWLNMPIIAAAHQSSLKIDPGVLNIGSSLLAVE